MPGVGGSTPWPYTVADQPGAGPWVQPSVSPVLSGWLQALFWSAAVVASVNATLAVFARRAFDDAEREESFTSRQRWVDLDDGYWGVTALGGLVNTALLVVAIVWMFKAHRATSALSRHARTWSSGWTIGAWFIPLGNLVIPKLVLAEIERIATAPRSHGAAVGRGRATVIGWLWWAMFVVGWVFTTAATLLGAAERPFESAGEMRAGYVCGATGFGAWALAGALGALHVRAIGRRLSPAGLAQEP